MNKDNLHAANSVRVSILLIVALLLYAAQVARHMALALDLGWGYQIQIKNIWIDILTSVLICFAGILIGAILRATREIRRTLDNSQARRAEGRYVPSPEDPTPHPRPLAGATGKTFQQKQAEARERYAQLRDAYEGAIMEARKIPDETSRIRVMRRIRKEYYSMISRPSLDD